MRGRVDDGGREAVTTLTVLGGSGRRAEVEATVGTGFTGALSLPRDLVQSLALPFVARGAAVLADGNTVETRVHRAVMIWHGQERVARVLASEVGPLVGMSLLRGSRLTVDVEPGGGVTAEELSDL